MKDERPETMEEMYSRENIEFLCQFKIRSRVLKILKENFECSEVLVIKERKEEKKFT